MSCALAGTRAAADAEVCVVCGCCGGSGAEGGELWFSLVYVRPVGDSLHLHLHLHLDLCLHISNGSLETEMVDVFATKEWSPPARCTRHGRDMDGLGQVHVAPNGTSLAHPQLGRPTYLLYSPYEQWTTR